MRGEVACGVHIAKNPDENKRAQVSYVLTMFRNALVGVIKCD